MIFLGADHRGFELKAKVRAWFEKWEEEYEDLGAHELNSKDDYTVFAQKVASLVADNKDSRGVILCGSGVGVDVVANKFDGVRSSIGKSPAQVKAGRHDDNMNILVIAADYTKSDEAKSMIKTFLDTKFGDKARYNRRLADIEKLEANN